MSLPLISACWNKLLASHYKENFEGCHLDATLLFSSAVLQKEPSFLLVLRDAAANNSQLTRAVKHPWNDEITPRHVKRTCWSEKTRLFLWKLLRYPAGPLQAVSIFRSHRWRRKEQPKLSLMWLKWDFQTHFIQRTHWHRHCPQHTDVAMSLERRDVTRQD